MSQDSRPMQMPTTTMPMTMYYHPIPPLKMMSPGARMPASVGVTVQPSPRPASSISTAVTTVNTATGTVDASARLRPDAPAAGQQKNFSESYYRSGQFPCTYAGCQEVFVRPSQLSKHTYVHTGDRPFACTICGQGFRTKWTLKKHGRTHTGEKPFSCEDCNRTFTQRGSWRRHIFVNHRKDIEARLDNSNMKMYRCSQCSKCFKFERNLKNHLPMHDNDGPDPESPDGNGNVSAPPTADNI
jgi:uncharacterized Zn-finger protein